MKEATGRWTAQTGQKTRLKQLDRTLAGKDPRLAVTYSGFNQQE
jgi:hypothetical protein